MKDKHNRMTQIDTKVTEQGAVHRVSISFNNHKIINMLPDGTHVIDTGGWRTPTVRQKIESVINKLGYTITQQAGIWYVAYQDIGKRERYVFTDGMKIRPSGVIENADLDVAYPGVTKRSINHYVAGWSEAWERGMHPPNPSDPATFYNAAIDKRKINFAELRQQMMEYYRGRYYFGSLIMVAINEVGGSKTGKLDLIAKIHIQDWLQHGMLPPSKLLKGSALAIRRLLRNFLYKMHGVSKMRKTK